MATVGLGCKAGLAIQQLQKECSKRPHSCLGSEFHGSCSNFTATRCAVSRVSHRQRRGKVVAMVAQVAENSREAALVEALVGVQGRGRAASATQLQVRRSSLCFWNFGDQLANLFLEYLVWAFVNKSVGGS